MLAVLGALLPEILQYANKVDFLEPVWWKVGRAKLDGDDLDYLGIPGVHIAGGQGILIIAVCQFFLMCKCSIFDLFVIKRFARLLKSTFCS